MTELLGAAPSHAIKNFRIAAGEEEGEFHGFVFQDSDVAKWIEAAAYTLQERPDQQLEETCDDVIELIGRAQQPDGYLNTYYTVKEPGKRWTNLRDNHELYVGGHFIEAAVAYYEATGKRNLLEIMCRFADYVDSIFGLKQNQLRGYDGHQEIELALLKLYRVTHEERYLRLAQFFIDIRGEQPHFFDIEAKKRGEEPHRWFHNSYSYSQSHAPVREQKTAAGHAVRAVYMYTAMADLASILDDESLKKTCKTLWNNVVQKQMYVTAGIGSAEFGESFSFNYDLPNDLAYTETCASIGLVFWAKKMMELEANGEYADVVERAIYNGTISGIQLDGTKFFYVNPLEVWPEQANHRHDYKHVKPERQPWFGCACCPPNIARLIASIGSYVYSVKDHIGFVNLYIGSETTLGVRGNKSPY
ncbi:glycoside hydrolase family 127 protein [Alkalicoccobacillus plakortidis]|uniref:glycoside hydrolase family 127 protein n=1 Tax=Alkalicoccobacillus plakortidis TaxID=444060 RepID=UPI002557EE96|nr:beta-L-arabinofuranosidase domain-containing protein [Alkalicoccobacillus plakortidis]